MYIILEKLMVSLNFTYVSFLLFNFCRRYTFLIFFRHVQSFSEGSDF